MGFFRGFGVCVMGWVGGRIGLGRCCRRLLHQVCVKVVACFAPSNTSLAFEVAMMARREEVSLMKERYFFVKNR